ncbi:hypothetical protein Cadr_000022445 [Camelus dromedarius]|uniref:Uncharacterized protein n=1 Tax=Camelus dromedarius TaxID=9838 RepID=A0A5N4CR50_CAMDR|nr:hypothetical protein Cadr_000022445 [Camelus dromedarius]
MKVPRQDHPLLCPGRDEQRSGEGGPGCRAQSVFFIRLCSSMLCQGRELLRGVGPRWKEKAAGHAQGGSPSRWSQARQPPGSTREAPHLSPSSLAQPSPARSQGSGQPAWGPFQPQEDVGRGRGRKESQGILETRWLPPARASAEGLTPLRRLHQLQAPSSARKTLEQRELGTEHAVRLAQLFSAQATVAAVKMAPLSALVRPLFPYLQPAPPVSHPKLPLVPSYPAESSRPSITGWRLLLLMPLMLGPPGDHTGIVISGASNLRVLRGQGARAWFSDSIPRPPAPHRELAVAGELFSEGAGSLTVGRAERWQQKRQGWKGPSHVSCRYPRDVLERPWKISRVNYLASPQGTIPQGPLFITRAMGWPGGIRVSLGTKSSGLAAVEAEMNCQGPRNPRGLRSTAWTRTNTTCVKTMNDAVRRPHPSRPWSRQWQRSKDKRNPSRETLD